MDTAQRKSFIRQIATIIGLCALAIICNVVGPGIFWNARSGSVLLNLAFAACGALVAEVSLLGIWCGLSLQPIKYRLPVTAALVLIVACSFSSGLQLADDSPPGYGMPVEVALLIAVAGFGMFVVLQIPLWVLRRTKHLRIANAHTSGLADSFRARQFSLGYLMLCTAVVGVLLVIVRSSLPDQFAGASIREIFEVILEMITYIALSSLLTMPCLWLALAEQRCRSALVILTCTFVVGPLFMLLFTNMIFGRQPIGELLPGVACYELGLTGTSLAVLCVLRRLGYRMVVTPN